MNYQLRSFRRTPQANDNNPDRSRLLLEFNNAVISQLDLESLLKTIFECVKQVFHQTIAATLSLYDAESDQLRVHLLHSSDPELFREGMPIDLERTPSGLAFTSRQTVLLQRVTVEDFPSDLIKRAVADGIKAGCSVPLISHGRAVGTLTIGAGEEGAYSEADAELLTQVGQQIAIPIENALAFREIARLKNKLASEKVYLEEEIQTEYNFAEIVGHSAALKNVLKQVATVAPTDSVVLICGETGTGKELIARAIHNLSARRERTLVKLNCAAIPLGLLESELFGHEKGAFTGAIAQRIGRFELAHKGTLLLDEIGEIPLDLQPKLLRVLQEQEFERLGSSRTIKADVRLVAATNCDLKQMVNEKKFRSDLFYRLNVFPVTVPPLRERTEDIPLLAGYFTQKHSLRMNRKIDSIPAETVRVLQSYHWPGNVRELENFIERAVILTQGSDLQAPLLELEISPGQSHSADVISPLISMEAMQKAHIEEVLRRTKGMVAGRGGAAEVLNMPASTLRSRMKKLGIK